MDEDSEVHLLRTYVNDLRRVKDRWFGYVDSEEKLIEFERCLVNCRVQFTTASSKISSGTKRHLMFCSGRGAVGVYLDMPFQVVRNVRKACAYGINRRKRQHEEDQHTTSTLEIETEGPSGAADTERCTPSVEGQFTDWTEDLFAPRKKPRGTKKIGCVANMHQKWVKVYPDFQVSIGPKTGVGKRLEMRAEAIRKLQHALDSSRSIRSELRIYLNMSALEEHTEHDFDEVAGQYQMIDKDVAKKITDLVREGITTVQEVKKRINHYVRDVLFAGKKVPDESCRAFFPSTHNLRNHIRTSLKKIQQGELTDVAVFLDHPACVSSYVTVDGGEDVTDDANEDVREPPESVYYVIHESDLEAATKRVSFLQTANDALLNVKRKQLHTLMEKCDSLLSLCNDRDVLDNVFAVMKNVYNNLAACAPEDSALHPSSPLKRRILE